MAIRSNYLIRSFYARRCLIMVSHVQVLYDI